MAVLCVVNSFLVLLAEMVSGCGVCACDGLRLFAVFAIVRQSVVARYVAMGPTSALADDRGALQKHGSAVLFFERLLVSCFRRIKVPEARGAYR